MQELANRSLGRTFYLDKEAIVWVSGRLVYLNPSAAFVWACLEEGRSPEATVVEFAEAASIARPQAKEDVDRLLKYWHAEGLFGSSASSPARPVQSEPIRPHPAPQDFRPVTERFYRLLDSVFLVRLQNDQIAQWVHPLLAHLELETDRSDHVVNVFLADTGILVTIDDQLVGRCEMPDEVAALVNVEMLLSAYPNAGGLTAFHAGAVGINGRCVLLPGESGSGKSTLTAGLVAAGCQHLSDELGLLMPGSHTIRPVPVCLAIKQGSWGVLREQFADLERLPIHRRLDGRLVRYMPPPEDARTMSVLPAACVAFPKYINGVSARVERVTTAQALRRITDAGYDLIDLSDLDVVSELVGWLSSTPCYSVEYSELEEGVEAIKDLVRE